MHILALETSCDETAVAIVEDGTKVLSNVIASSSDAFNAAGGVIPEEAARKQVQCILPVIHQALKKADCTWKQIDALAVTRGPGLLGSLLVGTTAARALASLHQLPLIGVHHTLGHLSSTCLDSDPCDGVMVSVVEPQFPVLSLSASGGHTELWLRTAHTKGTLLGRTRDDAAGEAFDKGASLLGLPYPGGPAISKAAESGDPDAFPFPLPLKNEDTLDFSFSGLKTALRYTIRDAMQCHPEHSRRTTHGVHGSTVLTMTPLPIADLAASYQAALCLHLCDRIKRALEAHSEIREIHIVGGVSANTFLRSLVQSIVPAHIILRFPKKISYCTDNAAMIGSAAYWMAQELREEAYASFETMASLPLAAALS